LKGSLRMVSPKRHSLLQGLGLRFPLIQAPMAGVQDHRLALAACESGILGSLPAAMLSLDSLERELRFLTQGTARAYNVNFFCHEEPPDVQQGHEAWVGVLKPYFDEWEVPVASALPGAGRSPFSHAAADVLEVFRPPVVSFHFGLPGADLLARVKSWGSVVLSSATTVSEGLWLQDHGADAVIAQGWEAGGHRGHFLSHDLNLQRGTLPLVSSLVEALRIPVIAAGGLSTAQALDAVFAAGAQLAQVGTAFLCATEATTSAMHRAALQQGPDPATTVTHLFTGRPARGLVNRLVRELGALNPAAPPFPLAGGALSELRKRAEAQGRSDFTAMWSGQSSRPPMQAPVAQIVAMLRPQGPD
jgi:nitronate monooxygenase